MIAVVDLKETVSVAAVADDVPPAVAVRPAGLLRCYCGEQVRVEAVLSRGRRDGPGVGDALLASEDVLIELMPSLQDGGVLYT